MCLDETDTGCLKQVSSSYISSTFGHASSHIIRGRLSITFEAIIWKHELEDHVCDQTNQGCPFLVRKGSCRRSGRASSIAVGTSKGQSGSQRARQASTERVGQRFMCPLVLISVFSHCPRLGGSASMGDSATGTNHSRPRDRQFSARVAAKVYREGQRLYHMLRYMG